MGSRVDPRGPLRQRPVEPGGFGLTGSLLFTLAVAGAVSFSVWVYSRREFPVQGRRTLALLRATTLAVVLLLLWNPVVPGVAEGAWGGDAPWILIDGSASMAAGEGTAGGAGASAWSAAREWAEDHAGGDARVVVFGGAEIGLDSVGLSGPELRTSLLTPALERAFESGASHITVVTDMRFSDAASVIARLRESLIPVRFEVVGPATVRNAGIGRFGAPASVSPRDSILLEFTILTSGIADSLDVRVLEEGRLVSLTRVVPPSRGREAVVRVMVPRPKASGLVRFTAQLSVAGDQFPLDDRRDVLLDVDPEARGLILLSFRPDWEPRFLLPVLGQVTGLTTQGFLQLSDGRFLSLGPGPDGRGVTTAAEVRDRVEGAEFLVLHGASADLPPWAAEAAVAARRVLVFAVDGKGGSLFGHTLGTTRDGEWYASSDPTSSVLAGRLAPTPWASLPPLTELLSGGTRLTGDVPLRVRFQGGGPAEPALVMTSEGSRRRVMVLATGFWRWAFRPGAPRQAYRRLWSAVGGWLLANEPLSGGPNVRPDEAVVPVNVAQLWRATEWSGQEIRLTIRGRNDVALDTVLTVGESGVFVLPGWPEGDYRYEVMGGSGGAVGGGRFLVDAHNGDMVVPIMTAPGAAGVDDGEGGAVGPRGGRAGRPVRTHPLPYLLVLVSMSLEWVLRRRRGLR